MSVTSSFLAGINIIECVEGLRTSSLDAFCNNTIEGFNNCTGEHRLIGNGRECKGKD